MSIDKEILQPTAEQKKVNQESKRREVQGLFISDLACNGALPFSFCVCV